MAKMEITGLDEEIMKLEKLSDNAHKTLRGDLGEGAGVIADKALQALKNMPTHSDDQYGTAKNPLYGASETEKDQIIDGFGISTFSDDGVKIETSVGFTGMTQPAYGKPVATGELAQCIEDGTDFRRGWHTYRKAIRGTKKDAEQAMQQYLDDAIDKQMEG